MASDSFAFDAYDRLVGRSSMVGSPVSVVVRNPSSDRIDEILDRSLNLLIGRHAPDEIILAMTHEPTSRRPSRIGGRSIRTVVHPRAADKEGLEWLIANARWPIAVFVGAGAELPPSAFQSLVEALEHADVVVGRRHRVRGRLHPLTLMLRRLFGVGVADLLSPYFALRRETFADVPLQIDEPLTVFELLAKSTFAFAMYDEVQVDVDASDATPIPKTLRVGWKSLVDLYRRPRFWSYSPGKDAVRIAPQETKPPRSPESNPFFGSRREFIHPLRRRSIVQSRPHSIGRRSADPSRSSAQRFPLA